MAKRKQKMAAAKPGKPEPPSGKLLVRMPRSLHASLKSEADREGVSVNQLIVAKLSIGLGRSTTDAIDESAA